VTAAVTPAAAPVAKAAAAAPASIANPSPAHAARAPKRTSPTHYTISVGTFLNADRADTERRKMLTVTPLAASVEKISEGGEESYRVLVGSFASHAAAVKAASDLMGTGQVREAMVLPATGAASN
jgi:cell division protein FtsN